MSIKDSETAAVQSLATFRDGAYHIRHDESHGALSTTVVMAICEVAGVETSEFQLYTYVDPDSLDSLFNPTATCDARVEIEVLGYRIAVHNSGEITIRAIGARAPESTEPIRATRSE